MFPVISLIEEWNEKYKNIILFFVHVVSQFMLMRNNLIICISAAYFCVNNAQSYIFPLTCYALCGYKSSNNCL